EGVDVVDLAHSPADGQRDEDGLGAALDHVAGGGAAVGGGGDVEEAELVGTGGAVGGGELDGVAGIAEVGEVHALDDASVVDVEAGDDTQGNWHAAHPTKAAGRL